MKYKMKDVRYTPDHGKSDEQCSKCRFFYGNYNTSPYASTCQVVHGFIDSNGWCMKFLLPPGEMFKK